MTTLSDEIKLCRDGAVDNPYQGDDKKILFVCSMGILRSATGARLYGMKHNTRAAGTYAEALVPVTAMLVAWAHEIVFVNQDNYPHMHPELVRAFDEQYERLN